CEAVECAGLSATESNESTNAICCGVHRARLRGFRCGRAERERPRATASLEVTGAGDQARSTRQNKARKQFRRGADESPAIRSGGRKIPARLHHGRAIGYRLSEFGH